MKLPAKIKSAVNSLHSKLLPKKWYMGIGVKECQKEFYFVIYVNNPPKKLDIEKLISGEYSFSRYQGIEFFVESVGYFFPA